jgi:hypothetical protein
MVYLVVDGESEGGEVELIEASGLDWKWQDCGRQQEVGCPASEPSTLGVDCCTSCNLVDVWTSISHLTFDLQPSISHLHRHPRERKIRVMQTEAWWLA